MSFAPGLNYRRMQTADLPTLNRLLPELLPGDWSMTVLQELLLSNHRTRVISTLDADVSIVGFVEYVTVVDEFELLNLAIARQLQGTGLGRLLLQKVIQEARNADCTRCLLEVRPSNFAAIALYVSEGFEMTGLRKGYYPPLSPSSLAEDALLYTLHL